MQIKTLNYFFDNKIYYDDSLTFQHFIESRKLTKAYVRSLIISQARASGNDLVYQSWLQEKSFLTLWFDNFKAIFSVKFYKYLAFLVTNYKNMRLHAIYFFVSFFLLLRMRFFVLKYQRKKILIFFLQPNSTFP